MSVDLLVKSYGFKCEGPARGRAFSLNLRLSGVSRICVEMVEATKGFMMPPARLPMV